MNDPITQQDHRAYTLAAKHALAVGLRYPECANWSDEHWPDFLDEAGDPAVIRRLEQEADQLFEEMQQLDAWMRLLAGPPPAEDAPVDDHVEYLEKVELEEYRLMFNGILPPAVIWTTTRPPARPACMPAAEPVLYPHPGG